MTIELAKWRRNFVHPCKSWVFSFHSFSENVDLFLLQKREMRLKIFRWKVLSVIMEGNKGRRRADRQVKQFDSAECYAALICGMLFLLCRWSFYLFFKLTINEEGCEISNKKVRSKLMMGLEEHKAMSMHLLLSISACPLITSGSRGTYVNKYKYYITTGRGKLFRVIH